MEGGSDDVAGALTRLLHDPLAEISLDAVDALLLEEMVEVDLLADH